MARRGEPTKATLKHLFALSGNQCAFPKCNAPLIVEGVLTGEVCHIRAASPEGPRYDPDQTEQERHALDNLIVLCQPHHTVIDADDVAYTVERLQAMKRQHESREHAEPSQATSELFVAAVLGSSVYGDVTNVATMNVYQAPLPVVAHPQLVIGFASDFLMPLQATTTLAPITGNSKGIYFSRDDNVSIRTENHGSISARHLNWSYVFPAGVAVWSGPEYDGKLHYLDMRWMYNPTQVCVGADLLNPGHAFIHSFRIQLPRDGRLEVPIAVTVGMLDEAPVTATLVAHIPDFIANALARKDTDTS